MKDNDVDDAMNSFHKTVSSVVLFLFAMVVNGVSVMFLWGWFVVPFGVEQIALAHSIGLLAMARFFIGCNRNNRDESFASLALGSVVKSLIITGFGWVVSTFM